MPYLFERINTLKEDGGIYAELPHCISDNLTERFEIRPYQEAAFCNYITYYEIGNLKQYRNKTLFHMATGSGKTFIMAGIILYLYQKGYRNFLFFVSNKNIISKTKDNFLNKYSSKYLFADKIVIDGQEVQVHEVVNFQDTDKNCINICFSTIQGIHTNFTNAKENSLTVDDFRDKDIVFISDEAHHMMVDTKKKRNNEENIKYYSWERVAKELFLSNPNNVLLEFTATCNLEDTNIKAEYMDKIVYQYDLKKYRLDGFSKEIKTVESKASFLDMALQALLFSQYRLKLFNDLHKNIKPIILFKSKTIEESSIFYKDFVKELENLDSSKLEFLLSNPDEEVRRVYSYFHDRGITTDLLAQELKDSFGPEHCVQINDESEAIAKGIAVNTLEEADNPYRAIFEVRMLDEGWDVLNLFDIVRTYDLRDAKEGVSGKTTMGEAQLIGRGARYCPFIFNEDGDKYKRKFDSDLENPFRVCEELYYHCRTNSKYISELKIALEETGIYDGKKVPRHLILKDEFKETDFYKYGSILVNDQIIKTNYDVYGLPSKVKDHTYSFSVPSRNTSISKIFDDDIAHISNESKRVTLSIKEIAEMNYNIVHSALRIYSIFKFDILKSYFPNIKSIRDFIEGEEYLANVRIEIELDGDIITMDTCNKVCVYVLGKISESLRDIKVRYGGTKEFKKVDFKEVFRDKIVNYTDPCGDGVGTSQLESSTYHLDLSNKDWFVFNDNYGTSEEKGFVYYFAQQVEFLKKKYSQIYLVRNERQLHIFSFDEGNRFEPDFLLFLRNKQPDGSMDMMQIFIEPKGNNLLLQDKWKEDFLLQIAEKWNLKPTTFIDDTEYRVIGLPFYNNDNRRIFEESFEKLI